MKKFLVLPAFVLAAALVGCEPADNTAPVVEESTTTTTTETTPAETEPAAEGAPAVEETPANP